MKSSHVKKHVLWISINLQIFFVDIYTIIILNIAIKSDILFMLVDNLLVITFINCVLSFILLIIIVKKNFFNKLFFFTHDMNIFQDNYFFASFFSV